MSLRGWVETGGRLAVTAYFGEQRRHCQDRPADTPLPELAEYQPDLPREPKSHEQASVQGQGYTHTLLACFGRISDILFFCML